MSEPIRSRREPPPLRRLEVVDRFARSPRMLRLVVGGSELAGLVIDQPAASVRLLVPWPGEPFVLPTWNGNEFLLADGRRPALRTFTPVRVDAVEQQLTLDIVRHDGGAVSGWAETARPGDPCAVSGPGRGETIAADASSYVLLGDETALPAIEQLLAAIPASIPVRVHLEIVIDAARLDLDGHPAASIVWHVADPADAPGAALRRAIADESLDADTRIWAAGEAASVQAIRTHLFDERGVPRSHTTLRGYWKVPRT